jgi:hypothetical protein
MVEKTRKMFEPVVTVVAAMAAGLLALSLLSVLIAKPAI